MRTIIIIFSITNPTSLLIQQSFTMKMKSTLPIAAILSAGLFMAQTGIATENQVYADFPITLKDYSGKKTDSVSYSGQAARHAIHDS